MYFLIINKWESRTFWTFIKNTYVLYISLIISALLQYLINLKNKEKLQKNALLTEILPIL